MHCVLAPVSIRRPDAGSVVSGDAGLLLQGSRAGVWRCPAAAGPAAVPVAAAEAAPAAVEDTAVEATAEVPPPAAVS